MRLVIQRVSRANVVVEGKTVSEIGNGLLVLVAWRTATRKRTCAGLWARQWE